MLLIPIDPTKKYIAVRQMQVVFWATKTKKERRPYNKQVSLAVKPPNWYGQSRR
jgi:hypothetical protein